MVNNPDIELNIEELVLHGFLPGDRRHIAFAVEQELSRLFTEQGLPPALAAGTAVPSMDGGAFHMPQGTKPAAAGQQIAQSVYNGFNSIK
jgi:hypothetical protein